MLLDDFKTSIGVSGTVSDDYYIGYFLKPAIDRAAVLATNIKQTVITLANGTQSYDLTSSSIASPVVGAAGIQELVYDESIYWPYDYKLDFYIDDLTTLYFPDSTMPITGEFTTKYNAFWAKPVGGDTPVETDMYTRLFPAVLKWANSEYMLKQITTGDKDGGVESKREENMQVSYGAIGGRNGRGETIVALKNEAEREMSELGANSKFTFYSTSAI